MTKYLTIQQVVEFQKILIKMYGGHPGIRDVNLLESALEAPKASFQNKQMYPSISDKAAALLFHLAKNHPFFDANKRTAYVSLLAFFKMNSYKPKFKISDLEQIVVDVADGKITKVDLLKIFKSES